MPGYRPRRLAGMDVPPIADLTAEIVWESSPDGLLLVDSAGTVVWANAEAERLFGYPASELLGQSVELLVPPELAERHRSHRGDYADSPRRRAMGTDQRLEGCRRDGSVFTIQVALSPLRLADAAYTIAAVRDLSPWVETEDRLADANRRRVLAEDHERIARELHDTIIQELFAVGLHLQSISGLTEGQVAGYVNQSIDSIDDIIRSIRTVIFDVSQPELREQGLRSAVIDLVADVTPSLGFEPQVMFRGPIDTAVPDSVVEHVLPTLREALTNVVKHAGANRVDVEIALGGGRLRLEVRDDGGGIEPDPDVGRGLVNLARRATLLGGEMRIEGAPAGSATGTTMTWEVPA